MSKFLRIVWAWCLAVALPLQGYAALAMPCGPAVPSGSAVAAHAEMHAEVHAEVLTQLAARVAADADCHAAMALAQGCSSGDPAAGTHGSHAGPCCAAASCCGAMALLDSLLTVQVMPPDRQEVPTIRVIRDRLIVGGLERPPRSAAC
jgi:hypothetical protein